MSDRQEVTLIRRASRAAMWNVVLLPVLALVNLAIGILIRRWFGLSSGIYDQVLGLLATVLAYSSVGIPTTLTKFLPEIEEHSGRAAVIRFLRRAVAVRVVIVGVVLVPMNLWANELAAWYDLGDDAVIYVRLLSALVVLRALFELTVKVHHAFLEHLQANLLAILQAMLDLTLMATALLLGTGMSGAIAALVASSALTASAGAVTAARALARLPVTPSRLGGDAATADVTAPAAVEATDDGTQPGLGTVLSVDRLDAPGRFAAFTTFTWVFELSLYFAGAGFAATVLGPTVGKEGVALFVAGFKLSFMTVGMVVTSFRGLYRPIFTRLRSRGDPEQLRRAFVAITKAQVVLLVPAGVGLAIMAGDYLPLLFDVEFAAAVPIARVLIATMFAETAFNLGIIVLSIDERYGTVLAVQSLLVLAAPAFVIAALDAGLVWAATIFGGVRLVVAFAGYLLCRRRYGFRFPWGFSLRVAAVSGVMGLAVAGLRWLWPTSVLEATLLTLLGASIYAIGVRAAGILGPAEVDLLQRSALPGQRWLVAWLAPGVR